MSVSLVNRSSPQECTSAGSPSHSPPTTRPLLLCSMRWIAWKTCSARAGEKEWYWASWCAIKWLSFATCGPRYLCSNSQITEADVRLFTTLIRFDEVYALIFKVRKQERLHKNREVLTALFIHVILFQRAREPMSIERRDTLTCWYYACCECRFLLFV